MSEDIKVNDKRINFEQESEARKIERKKMAEDYHAKTSEHNHEEFPQLDFATFVLSMSSTVLVHMGEIPEPETGTIMKNLPAAKQTIDLLSMLEGKTKGNLTPEEERILKDMLFELRMKYVQKAH